MKFRILLAALIAVPLLSACETEEDRVMADAQSCLNKATPVNVDSCVAKLNGITNQQSYVIRCTAHFIAQGITASTLAAAFQNIKGSTTAGVPSTTYAIAYLIFDDTITGHTAAQAMNECEISGATSLTNLIRLSSLANTFTGGAVANGDYSGLASAIAMYAGGDYTSIGQQAIDIKEAYCDNGGNFSGTDICNKMNQAYNMGGGTPATIGAFIQQYLDNI